MQDWSAPHFAHWSAQTIPTVQLTHFSQLVVPSHGDGSPDELLDTDETDALEFDEDKPEPPKPSPPAPPVPGESTTTLAPQPNE